ncbi:bridge-like lipid transfer protein family member 3A isoform X6 [Rhinoderma darwinii]|uniref:bridge-like lipid transfer protein family member 3A isoform X6 n=1 Tax=Rhinoderma darwinii TaxID=43563 RepID=UPI003F670049
MAAIIKRQILKHLSRFTKNLSPEQINLSTLRGEGQLTDLQLDEEALQNMLDLPTWLAITRVYCNRAAIRIQWTKLKTHPICLMLDKVEIEMKTCEDPRQPNGPSPIALAAGHSEYGFAEKVVEGMFLEIGCVIIKIESQTFRASLQLWQLQGYSVSPTWQQSDLRFTRLTHPQRGEVLTFKQVTWQTLRIEADASESCEDAPSTPLRLLTNGGRLNVALKRRTKDCMVLSSTLSFFLDELLWVLTDSQLRALLSYTKSLSEAVQKSVRQKKQIGVGQVPSPTTPPLWSFSSPNSSSSSLEQYFDRFDVKETSYHLLISRLEIHVCDESQTRGTVSGGAIQMTFRKITLDYYPTHKAGQSCAHWSRHSPAMSTCEQWTQKLAEERQAKEGFDVGKLGKMSSPKNEQGNTREPSLYFRSVLIRIDDMDIHQVSTSGQTPQKPPLLSCHHIPSASSAVYLQYIEYYRLPGECLPVPPPALYMQLHGVLLYLAAQSILWLNFFMLDLSHHLQQLTDVSSIVNEEAIENRDLRLDGFNLKLSFPVTAPTYSPPDRPSSVCAHLSSVTLTNTCQAPGSNLDLLQKIFRSFAAHEDFHSPPGPLHPPEDSERSSLVGSELVEGDMAYEKKANKTNRTVKGEIVDSFFGTGSGEEPPEVLDAQKETTSQLHRQNSKEQKEDVTKDSLQGKVLANDAVQTKELIVDLSLGKEFTRDTLLSTLGLTRETFSLGKERMQRFLSDTKHKDVEVLQNRSSSPLSRTQSLDTVSIDGLDVLSLDSETTENFILKLDAEMTLNGESVLTEEDDTSQSTEGAEPQQILTVALHNVSSVSRLFGDDVTVTVKALDISCAQKVEDLKGLLVHTPSTTTSSPRMILNFNLGPTAAYLSRLAVHNGFLQLRIQDLSSEVPISALTHIGPFLEDEQIPRILPMIIQVTNSKIILRDDGPRIYPSPIVPEPVAFLVENLKVQRQEDGVFWLTGNGSSSLVLLPTKNTSQELPGSKEALHQELLAARAKLEQQQKQEQRLLEEIRKYNPQFHL